MTVGMLDAIMGAKERRQWQAFYSIQNELEAQHQAQMRAEAATAKYKAKKKMRR